MKYRFLVDYMSNTDICVGKGQIVEVTTVFDNLDRNEETTIPDCNIKWEEKQEDGTIEKREAFITLEALQFCAERIGENK